MQTPLKVYYVALWQVTTGHLALGLAIGMHVIRRIFGFSSDASHMFHLRIRTF